MRKVRKVDMIDSARDCYACACTRRHLVEGAEEEEVKNLGRGIVCMVVLEDTQNYMCSIVLDFE